MIGTDIIVLENKLLFDSRKFKEIAGHGQLMKDQFLYLLSYVAEQERKKNKQRQAEGIRNAQKNGIKSEDEKWKLIRLLLQLIMSGNQVNSLLRSLWNN